MCVLVGYGIGEEREREIWGKMIILFFLLLLFYFLSVLTQFANRLFWGSLPFVLVDRVKGGRDWPRPKHDFVRDAPRNFSLFFYTCMILYISYRHPFTIKL